MASKSFAYGTSEISECMPFMSFTDWNFLIFYHGKVASFCIPPYPVFTRRPSSHSVNNRNLISILDSPHQGIPRINFLYAYEVAKSFFNHPIHMIFWRHRGARPHWTIGRAPICCFLWVSTTPIHNSLRSSTSCSADVPSTVSKCHSYRFHKMSLFLGFFPTHNCSSNRSERIQPLRIKNYKEGTWQGCRFCFFFLPAQIAPRPTPFLTIRSSFIRTNTSRH